MAYKEHCSTFLPGDFTHLSETLLLKLGVNLQPTPRRQPKSQARGVRQLQTRVGHTYRMRSGLTGGVREIFSTLGKGNDFIKLLADFLFPHPKNRSVEENVLPSG